MCTCEQNSESKQDGFFDLTNFDLRSRDWGRFADQLRSVDQRVSCMVCAGEMAGELAATAARPMPAFLKTIEVEPVGQWFLSHWERLETGRGLSEAAAAQVCNV